MTPAPLSVAVRRLWPRRARTRLAVMYTVLFLLAGIALLALIITVVAIRVKREDLAGVNPMAAPTD